MNSIEELLESATTERAALAGAIKKYLLEEETRLSAIHKESASGLSITRQYTKAVDSVLRALIEKLSKNATDAGSFAVTAIGGYGRGELNIRSDIDLMFLHRGTVSPGLEALSKEILYVLWDTGLDVAFSIRSSGECMALADTDTKTKTALLDLRFICGDASLFDEFYAESWKCLFSGANLARFFDEKTEEMRLRRSKYGGSVYILEPNVKEGEGGLRDAHTAFWLLKAKHGLKADAVETGSLTETDMTTLDKALDFLHWVRNDLHFHSKRKNDQLTFDNQERIAQVLGLKDSKESIAVEKFTHRYYRHALDISRISSAMISRLTSGERTEKKGQARKVNGRFFIKRNVLEVAEDTVFKDSPVAMLFAFEEAARHGKCVIGQHTKDLIASSLHLIGDGFRSSPEASEAFLSILASKSPYAALTEMHSVGLLEKYIPEFADITCRAQHDMYHVYTVDAHSLFAIREAEKLAKEYKSEFQLLSTLYNSVKSRAVLLLGILFHDIGKSKGKGHAEKGAEMVPRICKRLGLNEDDAATVKFLVARHLIIADTAQYRDMHDEKLIVDFAAKVGSIERLNLLYLLTFADVRAVGPEVWSQWKATLFQELYFRVLTVLERGSFEPEDTAPKIEKIRLKVLETLKTEKTTDEVTQYFKMLPPRYFLATNPKTIASHIKLVRKLKKTPVAVLVKQVGEREYTDITVATDDVHGLFSMITGVMLANSINILGASINTLRNGIALDTFHVNNVLGELLTNEVKLKKMESDLTEVITGRVKIEKLVGTIKPSILDKKAKPKAKTRVQIDNDVSDAFTVLDIHTQDRLGLLYTISSTLTKAGAFIHIAKISTKGETATDILYIRDIFGQKILDPAKVAALEDTLTKALEEA
ncbi:MAG: [protein-PII] uridylyltransferase [Deltaproteobacteria bacterium]|nr:[protein-PII] uridylyltransferase [Deltaproteobacteria bacterium]